MLNDKFVVVRTSKSMMSFKENKLIIIFQLILILDIKITSRGYNKTMAIKKCNIPHDHW